MYVWRGEIEPSLANLHVPAAHGLMRVRKGAVIDAVEETDQFGAIHAAMADYLRGVWAPT